MVLDRSDFGAHRPTPARVDDRPIIPGVLKSMEGHAAIPGSLLSAKPNMPVIARRASRFSSGRCPADPDRQRLFSA